MNDHPTEADVYGIWRYKRKLNLEREKTEDTENC